MRVGVQEHTEYTGRRLSGNSVLPSSWLGAPAALQHTTTQVFASGIPNPEMRDVTGKAAKFYRMFLRSQYRATFAVAVRNAVANGYQGASRKLFLTGLGVGVWQSEATPVILGWIHEAIADSMALYRNCGLEVVFVVGNADSARLVQPLVEARMKKAVEDAKAGAHRDDPTQADVCVGFRPAGEDEEDGVSGDDGAEITLLGWDTDGEGGPDDEEASRPNGSWLMWLLLAVCIAVVAGLSVGIVALVLCCCRAGDDNRNASAEVAAASEDINEAGFLISDEKVSTALG
eukprot:g11357.t1